MSDSTAFSVKDTSLDVLVALANNEHAPRELRLQAVNEALTRPLARVEEDPKVTTKRREGLERLRDSLNGVWFAAEYDDPHKPSVPVVAPKVEHGQSGPPAPKVKFVAPDKAYDELGLETILRARNILRELVVYFEKPVTECSQQDVIRFCAYSGLGQENPVTQAMCLAQSGYDIGGSRESE